MNSQLTVCGNVLLVAEFVTKNERTMILGVLAWI